MFYKKKKGGLGWKFVWIGQLEATLEDCHLKENNSMKFQICLHDNSEYQKWRNLVRKQAIN